MLYLSMNFDTLPAYAAALFSSALAVAALIRRRRTFAAWCFSAGMMIFCVESIFNGLSQDADSALLLSRWLTFALLAKCALPAAWIGFSLSYSRGNYLEFLSRWRFLLVAALVLPFGIAAASRADLLQLPSSPDFAPGMWLHSTGAARLLDVLLLVAFVIILTNLEKTLRSAIGTMRWKIKFLILGLAVMFGARVYTQADALLFSGHSLALASIDSLSVLIGCILVAGAYLRSGFAEIEIYPSHAFVHGSFTVVLVGGYLFIVGVLAQVVAFLGAKGNFQLQAFCVLLAIAALAVLILSERLRQRLRNFVARHFQTSQRDVRKIWTLFTRSMASVLDQPALCLASARLVSETFNTLSVTIWLLDKREERLIIGASTAIGEGMPIDPHSQITASEPLLSGLRKLSLPFDLETVPGDWCARLREASPSQFRGGGNRLGIPLMAGDHILGIALLADRVNGVRYTVEELDLLKCIGDQIAAALLNLRLSEELVYARELQAFQTMSAFFVHDLKNAASSLGLMLKNLPVHFDDPAFREDTLRGIASTTNRINQLIAGLYVLRNKLDLKPVELDLNQLLAESMEEMKAFPNLELIQALHPLPKILADREHLRTVFTNLLLNAADAVGGAGRVTVQTHQRDGHAVISVVDDGCGMSDTFLRTSLFRPFQTTKKRGIGIGMFQSKMIVEAHRGNILVQSETGRGTTFEVSLPITNH
jgi:putative PEP-CTERM system histidine kinase